MRRDHRRHEIRHERREFNRELRLQSPESGEADVEERRRDLSAIRVRRESLFIPTTVDQATRTIRAILSTDYPVRLYDYGTDTIIDEVLLPSGMRFEGDSIQLIESHSYYDVRSVLGSIDQLTRNGTIEGRLRFSSASDVEPIWTRVAEGHLRNLSIGATYTRNDYIELQPGKTRSMNGVSYLAEDVPKRLVKRWYLREASLVVFGADPNARTRDQKTNDRIRNT
jgi:hypothetical protein